ncbi:MAG: electron transfer flavoprotein subunit beta/FixA family protein [Myxococcota bacterium]|nr:electron transfer flavoprotein subunit beta/FixA family protein [Myxococcota bacterium]
MKILVTAKRVTDYDSKLSLTADGRSINYDNVDFKMNPFCEIAVEAAIQVAESEQVDDAEIVVVTIGDEDAVKEIRTAMAMGAHRGIHVECEEDQLDSALVAQMLGKICADEEPDLVILGKQAVDGDSNQVGQLIAEQLGWPQATFAYQIKLNEDASGADVLREVDGGVETISLSFPAVITTDLRLNTPRYASLPGIMKAKRKPLETVEPDDLDVDIDEPLVEIVGYAMPSERAGGQLVGSVDELLDKLRGEAKVL